MHGKPGPYRRSGHPALSLVAVVALASGACQDVGPAKGERRIQPALVEEQNQRRIRETLLQELKPVTLANCSLKRFGSAHDGGYLMCENLLAGVEAAYSYGIGGNDEWGCDVSARTGVPVHQYDCFEPPALTCAGGRFLPHAECVGPTSETTEGRVFDTISNQIARNGDTGKRLIIKIDVEGAEWDTLLATPDEVLEPIMQLAMELHGTSDARFLEVLQKLKRIFHLVHLHFNNHSCSTDVAPFPAKAYQVLFVNKRVGTVGAPAPPAVPAQSLDAPDNPEGPDCQLPSS